MDEGPFSSCGNSTTFFFQVFVDSLGNFMANCWYHLGCVGSKREYQVLDRADMKESDLL